MTPMHKSDRILPVNLDQKGRLITPILRDITPSHIKSAEKFQVLEKTYILTGQVLRDEVTIATPIDGKFTAKIRFLQNPDKPRSVWENIEWLITTQSLKTMFQIVSNQRLFKYDSSLLAIEAEIRINNDQIATYKIEFKETVESYITCNTDYLKSVSMEYFSATGRIPF